MSAEDQGRSRLKLRWTQSLLSGASSLIVAAAVVTAAPAEAKRLDPTAPVRDRVEKARAALGNGVPLLDTDRDAHGQLAWWGNGWGNGGWGWHPGWHNWPNWHNWHNWHNWGNW